MKNKTFKSFFTVFIPLSILVSAGIIYIYDIQKQRGIELVEKREYAKVQLLKDNLRDFYDPMVANVNYLAEREKVKFFLQDSLKNRSELERDLKVIAKAVNDYDQIRLLDITGQEMLRINNYGDTAIVQNDSLLQDKSQREYIKQILLLEKGKTYIGAIDLNLENGIIEKPLKSVVRVGKKIFSEDGEPIGMVVINHLMNSYLKNFGNRFDNESSVMLLTSNGYWLAGPKEFPKFSHLLNQSVVENFENRFSEDWKSIEASDSGFFVSENGLFVFDRLKAEGNQKDKMIVLTMVNMQLLNQTIGMKMSYLIVLLLIVNALIALVSYSIANGLSKLQISIRNALKTNEDLEVAQIELERTKTELENRVEERTKELNEAKLYFQGIFDNTFQFIGLLKPNGCLLEANKTALDFGGFTMEQARGLNFWDAPWWSLSEETQLQLKEAIFKAAEGDFVRYDVMVLGGDGNAITIDFSLRPIIKEEKVVYLVAEGRNITEKIALEKELKESETSFRTIFETVDSGLVYQDEKGLITSANAAAERILGLSIEEMTGRKSADPRWKAIREDGSDYPGETHPPMIALHTGKEVKAQLMGIFHPGKEKYVWLKVSAYPIFEEGEDKPIRVYSTFEDITEEYHAKRELKESETRFRAVFENSSVGIALIGKDEVSTEFNDAFQRLLGYPKEKLKQLTFSEITHTDYLERDLELYQELLDGKRSSYRIEKKCIKYDESMIWVDLFISSMKDVGGEHKCALALVLDISDKKNAKELIENINKKLEAKVEERTFELSEANKELESFSYSVSHDLRAPLRAVNSFAKILEEDYYDKLDEEGRDNLKIISDNGKYMGQLIDDLLQFSRLGRQDLTEVKVDMNGLVEETLELQGQSMNLSKFKIDVQELAEGKGDKDLIKQVMVNLISNAIKYSSKAEKPKVVIGSKMMKGKVTYFVKDNGVGFNTDYADKLFGVFQRLHSQEEFEGTGVGLAIVERIIKRHGGKVWVEAELNKGATFFFQLE